jgi:alpha-mannosidase
VRAAREVRVHVDVASVEGRVRRLLEERLRPAVRRDAVACAVGAFVVDGEPVVPAVGIAADYQPIAPGTPWGRPWGTTWLRVAGHVPPAWSGRRVELVVDLGFGPQSPGFQAEGLVFDESGVPMTGIAPRNDTVPLELLGAGAGDAVLVYVEAASNPAVMGAGDSFAPTRAGDRATAGTDPLYRLGRIELCTVDEELDGLCLDVEVLVGLAAQLEAHDPRQAALWRALDQMADAVDLDDVPGSARAARAELAEVLASPAHASAHRVTAVGHAHIDSAWLWPVRETVRKCARTFANVLSLAERHPELVFACSQAQQYAWVRDSYPELFEGVRARVRTGQWVPVGGTWVEPDGNLCGSEALARQLVLGRRFFADELGVECPEVWLPDSFGYSAAWPQLARLAGARYFLTQKLSWNQTNVFPHSTFLWEGIDGTRILTHFPPVATYNAELSPEELARASRGDTVHGLGTRSLVPFGYGDGGGGPTHEMLERAARQRDLEGSPRVEVASPATFFREVEEEQDELPVWSGELYLELHRGTFTSQARLKRANRRCEHLLREAELWWTAVLVAGLGEYPDADLDSCWKTLLLQQFHDILPGSSIAWVNDDAAAAYAGLEEHLEELVGTALSLLTGPGDDAVACNAGPFALSGVPALGAALLAAPAPGPGVTIGPGDTPGSLVLDNGLVRLGLDAAGLLASVRDLVEDRELVAPGCRANLLQLHRDLPNRWDAWDVDAFYRRSVVDLDACEAVEVVEDGPAQVVVEVRRRFGARGASRAVQRVRLRALERRVELETEVDWQEDEKLLKLAFPVDVRAEWTSAEIQYGHVRRPLHVNTSWDAARFEVVMHRFVHLGEDGYGVALASDSTYGYDATRTTRPDGGTTTTVRLSLVRGPRFPDPRADHGHHRFGVVLAPGATARGAVAEGYRANLPLRVVMGSSGVAPVVAVDDGGRGAVVVEAVKAADDRSGAVVVRLYEALGGRARALLTPGFPAVSAARADLLERPLAGGELARDDQGGFALELRPFEVVTLVLRRPPA